MNKKRALLWILEATSILLLGTIFAVWLARMVVSGFDLWSSPVAEWLATTQVHESLLKAFFAFLLASYIWHWLMALAWGDPYEPLKLFDLRTILASFIAAAVLIGVCAESYSKQDRRPAFVDLYKRLNGHAKINELQKQIVINGNPSVVKKIHEDISAVAGREFEIHFIREAKYSWLGESDPFDQVLVLWDADAKKSASELFQPRLIDDGVWGMALRNSVQPYVFEELGAPHKRNIPLVGLMRFNTPDGELLAFVETPPNIVTFKPPEMTRKK